MPQNDRYDRQKLIKGWDQNLLTKGKVTIVGSGDVAKYVALPLVSLGVGDVRIVDNAPGNDRDMLLDISLGGDSRSEALASALEKINPGATVTGINYDLSSRASLALLEGSGVVIDATNNIRSKSSVYELFLEGGKKTRVISASSNSERGKIVMLNKSRDDAFLMPMFSGQEQDPLISMGLGGVISEEVKKILMGSKRESMTYDFNAFSDERFFFRGDLPLSEQRDNFRDKRILVVGAGALGCFLGPAIIESIGPKTLDIMDFDDVEGHNLNRQVCHYDAVGKKKAESLERVLSTMSRGETKVRGIDGRFTEDFAPEEKYDLIFDAVDSFFAKSLLHNYSLSSGTPLVSGGTSYRAVTVLSHLQGETSCFNCQIDLDQLALKAEIIRRTSCIQSPDPSVIMTNQIAGALMVGEGRRILSPEQYGLPLNGLLRYVSDLENRGGITENGDACDCYTRPTKGLVLPDADRVLVKEIEVDGEIGQEIYLDGKKL